MKIIFYFILLSTLLISCKPQTENDFWEETQKEVPSDWFYAQRAYPNGKIDKAAYKKAILSKKAQTSFQRSINPEWEFAGPTNVGGRVTDIEMPDASFDIIYVGAASGGIFKTENGGQSFEPIFDEALSLSIGDIALAPSNQDIIYVGTGEANAGGGSLAYDGMGVYRSDDAGDTWTHLGLENAGSIGKVEVDPSNSNIAYVATMGNLFTNDGQRGVFRTTDSGQNWEQVLFISDSTGVVDLAIHPDNPNTIYAAAWERVRRPQFRSYGGPTSGIYRSTDGGDNWTELTNGLPSVPELKGRIGIGIAPSDADIVYAVYAASSGPIAGAFRSDDGGENWTEINTDGVDNVPFMWWFGKVVVHPENPDRLYYLSLNAFESQNAGTSWDPILFGQHVDQHDIFIHPANPALIISANDGGVYKSEDNLASFSQLNNLPITQFYGIEIDESAPDRLYGGTQDNGTNRTLTGNTDDWEEIFGGDGMHPMVNPQDNAIVYAGFQNGSFFKSVNGGFNFSNATNGISSSDRKNWNTPKAFDPNNPEIMYYGANKLYKSEDGADSWEVISPDLTNGSGGGNLTYGTIISISVSPLDGNEIWVGTDDGNIAVTTDGGNNWETVTGIPDRWVTRVSAHPNIAGYAYATLSGYRYGADIGQVLKIENQGNDWQDISGDLPDIPVNDIIINPETEDLYIATDVGVFYSFDNGGVWEVLGTGLPNVPVTDLDFYAPENKLVAGTYGRSMYSINVSDLVSVQDLNTLNLEINLYPNPFKSTSTLAFDLNTPSNFNVAIYTSAGELKQTLFSGPLSAGNHNFNIDGSGWSPGVYFCRIKKETGQHQSIKLLRIQ